MGAIAFGHRCPALVLALCGALTFSGSVTAIETPDTNTPATGLRISLSESLAEHAYLVLGAMRATALDAPDAPALSDALASNSTALADVIASVYGQAASTRFAALWDQHVDLLVRYAGAVRDHDDPAATAARQGLDSYVAAFDTFLADATHRSSGAGESHAVQLHVAQLRAFADADYTDAYVAARAAYAHMFELGDDLARTIGKQFPDRFPGAQVAFSPAAELRVTLDRLLGEHLVLSAEAMRSGIAGTPDIAAAQAALDANTTDLKTAIAKVYGSEAGATFGELWATHTRVYVAYVDALRRKDAPAQADALTRLRAYNEQVAAFLAGANPNLDRAGVSTMIAHHVQALIAMADAYQAGDYVRGVSTIREAHRHMFEVGDALAAAIAAQFPGRFRDLRLPPTDVAGGREPKPGDGGMILVMLLVLLGAAWWAFDGSMISRAVRHGKGGERRL